MDSMSSLLEKKKWLYLSFALPVVPFSERRKNWEGREKKFKQANLAADYFTK